MANPLKTRLVRAACAAALALTASTIAPVALAQTATPQSQDGELYVALGGKAGIESLIGGFTQRLTTEPRTASFFEGVDLPRLRGQMVDQFCQLAGGPCVYKGKSMTTVHSAQDIGRADFNAVVEVLQDAMDAERIDFRVQNRLLAKLAPMHRDIVNAPAPGVVVSAKPSATAPAATETAAASGSR
ncbi:MAG: group 1 truncated hemoglobin [Pseudomonadota bacterium]|nr:group 1 truncated hemoglobin [Pseudomonadota bacterium]